MKHQITLRIFCLLSVVALLQFSTSYAQVTESSSIISSEILKTTESWNGADISYPFGSEEITALHIEFAPGAETSWHRHPVPSLAYVISGKLEVFTKDGQSKTFSAGDAFAEVVDTWHYGKNIGDEPVRLAVFYIGSEGMELTELLPDDQNEEH